MKNKLNKLTEVEHHAPIVDREKSQTYITLLESSIDNEDIYNIALSGPYGSGKSTILKTLMSRDICGGNRYLEISLASFDEKDKEGLGYLIEKSILQQFFYKVSKDSIPYSRLTRITSYSFMKIASIVGVIFTWIASYYFVINQDKFDEIFTSNAAISTLHTVFTVTSIILLWQIVKKISSLRLSKLIVQNAEIEWGGGESSLLNKYLDEILYFFEETKYSVVVIEDLDRYGKTDIFEKLRELNILINSYEKIKHKVTFIYAVKDSLFSGSDRTKFFDYIIPVIPVINMSNAKDKLQEKIESIGYENLISQDLLKEISFHIADYRRLLNIFSEFKVYVLELKLENSSSKDLEQLFCMIVYKNFFPQDFELLHGREGMLYDVFHLHKNLLVENLLNNIQIQIKEIEECIQESEDEHLTDESELKIIFVTQAFSKHANVGSININNKLWTIYDVAKDPGLFDSLRKLSAIHYYNVSGNNLGSHTFDFSILNVNGTYDERIKFINDKKNSTVNMFKKNLLQLKQEQSTARHCSLAELIALVENQDIKGEVLQFNPSDNTLKSNIELVRAWELIKYFISNEYITENYSNFTSYFYDILISMNDFSYINSIRNNEPSDHYRAIDNSVSLLENIAPSYFKYKSVLNVQLIEHLFMHSNDYPEHYDLFMDQLVDKGKEISDFIITYLANCSNHSIDLFIKAYCEKRDDLWNRVVDEWKLDNEQVDVVLKSIITSLDINTIVKIDVDASLSSYLSKKADFLFLTSEISNEVFFNLVSALKIKFKNLNNPTLEVEIERLKYLLVNSFYKINDHMLSLMLTSFSKTAESVMYSSIKRSELSSLIVHIDENLSQYVTDVWIKINTPIHEEEKYYLELLNSNFVDNKQKASIIEHTDTHVMDISELESTLWKKHILENRIEPTWINVLRYFYEFSDEVIDEALAEFLNREEVYTLLAHEGYLVDEELFDSKKTDNLFATLTKSMHISENALEYYYKSFNTCWANIDISSLTPERGLFLVEVGYLCVNPGNYTNLQTISSTSSLAPHVKLIERQFEKVLSEPDAYYVDCDDIQNILESDKINTKLKLDFLEKKINILLDCDKIEFVELIVDLALTSVYLDFTEEFTRYLLDSGLSMKKKMKLLATILDNYSHDFVTEMLILLGSTFNDIASNTGLRPKIKLTDESLQLVQALENIDYIYSNKIEKDHIRVITKKL